MKLSPHEAMSRALELADRGWGRVQPNPLVGAVILSEGEVVGEGWHAEFGGPHAERVAIEQAGALATGATLYTTLEPCNHEGKQPACVDAILDAGISHIVCATLDPNRIASGGLSRLGDAGVTSEVGLLGSEARRQNSRFFHAVGSSNRPFVALKLAVSLDGFIADHTGSARWLSGAEARDWVHRERVGYSAIAAGAKTVVTDDARLTARGPLEPRVAPVRVVFDRSGLLTGNESILAEADGPPVIVVHPPGLKSELAEHPMVSLVEADSLLDGLVALKQLGLESILVEGGGRLAAALVDAGLVDRVYQIQTPIVLGGGVPAWPVPGPRSLGDAIRWKTVGNLTLGEDTLIVMEC